MFKSGGQWKRLRRTTVLELAGNQPRNILFIENVYGIDDLLDQITNARNGLFSFILKTNFIPFIALTVANLIRNLYLS